MLLFLSICTFYSVEAGFWTPRSSSLWVCWLNVITWCSVVSGEDMGKILWIWDSCDKQQARLYLVAHICNSVIETHHSSFFPKALTCSGSKEVEPVPVLYFPLHSVVFSPIFPVDAACGGQGEAVEHHFIWGLPWKALGYSYDLILGLKELWCKNGTLRWALEQRLRKGLLILPIASGWHQMHAQLFKICWCKA